MRQLSRWIHKDKKLENASNAHEAVRKIFLEDPFFEKMRCWQEVPMSDLCLSWKDKSHRVDWFIESLGTVIELHGRQHYEAVDFGGEGQHVAEWKLRKRKMGDQQKRDALVEAGYAFVEIPYTTKITAEALKEAILGE